MNFYPLEGTEWGQNGTSNPNIVPPLWWGHYLDFHAIVSLMISTSHFVMESCDVSWMPLDSSQSQEAGIAPQGRGTIQLQSMLMSCPVGQLVSLFPCRAGLPNLKHLFMVEWSRQASPSYPSQFATLPRRWSNSHVSQNLHQGIGTAWGGA